MEEDTESIFTASSANITFQPVNSNILSVNGPGGSPLFTIKPNGEFVPGPGLETKSISEFSKIFYTQMTIFGKSFAETLESKERKIKELERQIEILKSNGTRD